MMPDVCQPCKFKDRCNQYKKKHCKKLDQWKRFLSIDIPRIIKG